MPLSVYRKDAFVLLERGGVFWYNSRMTKFALLKLSVVAGVVCAVVLTAWTIRFAFRHDESARTASDDAPLSPIAHDDTCVDACLAGSDEKALEHLAYQLEANRAAMKVARDDKSREILQEVISGIEAHINYIKAGRR